MAVGSGVMGSQHISTLDVLPFWGQVCKLGDKTTQSTAIVEGYGITNRLTGGPFLPSRRKKAPLLFLKDVVWYSCSSLVSHICGSLATNCSLSLISILSPFVI